jgi:hypothetical protein
VAVAALLFFFHFSWADKVDLCEDLKPLVCSQESRDDGTGLNQKYEDKDTRKIRDINKLTNENKNKFAQLLSESQNSEFRRDVFNALPFKRKDCPSPESLMAKTCQNYFAAELAEIVDAENLAPSYSSEEGLRVRNNYEKNLRNIERLTGRQEYLEISNEHYKEIRNLNIKPDQEKKIKEDLFPQVKKTLLKKIDELSVDDEIKMKLKAQIDNTEFGGFDCLDNPRTTLKYLEAQYLPKADLNYSRSGTGKNKILICRGISSYVESEFSLIFTLAHELSHSIGPCLYSEKFLKSKVEPQTISELDAQYPFSQTLTCLRGNNSTKAQNKLDFCKENKKNQRFDYNECEILTQNPTLTHCPTTISKDQVEEATSDFFGVEVMQDLIKERHPDLTPEQWKRGISNLFPMADNCHENKSMEFDVHPKQMIRFNKIALAHPRIREAMGCSQKSSTKVYCDPGFYSSESKNKKEDGQMNGVQK